MRALRGAPEAFGTTAADAEELTPAQWRQRFRVRVSFIAVDGQSTVGLACGVPGDAPGEAELISMWVEPDWRRRGIGGRLVDAVIGWAAERGYDSLRLWVAEGNVAAERFYASLGFRRTGAVQPMGGTSPRLEFAMRRDLATTG